MKKTIIASVLLLVSGFALAQQSGFYIGGSIGEARIDVGNAAANAIIDSGGYSVSGSSDNTDTSYKFFGGYKVNQYFELEGGYASLGKYKSSGTGTIARKAISAVGEAKSYAMFVDAVGILPVGDKFSLFGRFGFAYTKTDANASAWVLNAPFSASVSTSSSKPVTKFGLGAQYYVTKTIALRAEYEHYLKVGDRSETGESDVKVYTAGITIGF